jgi:5-methylcytosine-specific restriction endonuclease McrA
MRPKRLPKCNRLICSDCHKWKRIDLFSVDNRNSSGRQSRCKRCQSLWVTDHKDYLKEYDRRRYINSPEKFIAKTRNWRVNNPNKYKDQNKNYYLKNKEKVAEYSRKRYLDNREYFLAKQREWVERNKEWVSKYKKNWASRNKESTRVSSQKCRARRLEAMGNDIITLEEWLRVLDFYGHRCLCCGNDENISMDHIVPLSRGGKHSIDNVQPLCKSCNSKKSTKTTDYRKAVNEE